MGYDSIPTQLSQLKEDTTHFPQTTHDHIGQTYFKAASGLLVSRSNGLYTYGSGPPPLSRFVAHSTRGIAVS